MKFLRGDNAGDMKKIYKSSIQRLLFFFLTLAIQIYIIILAILQFKNYFLYFYIISLIGGDSTNIIIAHIWRNLLFDLWRK